MSACPKCHGTGVAPEQRSCGATLEPNSHEVIECWGIPHDGPHAAIQCSPCTSCAVLGSSGDYLNIAAIERPGTLSSGEQVLVAFAQAIYTQTPNVQASITELGKLDGDAQNRVLRAIAGFYDAGTVLP